MILWRREGKSGLSGNKVFVMVIFFLSAGSPHPAMLEAVCLVHFFLAVSDTVSWLVRAPQLQAWSWQSTQKRLWQTPLISESCTPSQPCLPTSHPSSLPSPCFSTFVILLPSNICSRDRNRYLLCFAVEGNWGPEKWNHFGKCGAAEKWQCWAATEDSGRQPRARSLCYVAFRKGSQAHSFLPWLSAWCSLLPSLALPLTGSLLSVRSQALWWMLCLSQEMEKTRSVCLLRTLLS